MNPFRRKRPVRDAVIAGLLFLLLREWLKPLSGLPVLGELAVFHRPLEAVLLGLLVIHYLRLPLIVSALLQGVLLLGVVRHLYFSGAWHHPSTWLHIVTELSRDLGLIVLGNWMDGSPAAWMMVFLIGLAMLVYSLYHLSLQRQTAGLLTMATAAGLLVLHAALGWNDWQGVLRVLVWGLALAAVQRLTALEARWSGRGWLPVRLWWRWSLASALVIAVAVAAGWFGMRGEVPAWEPAFDSRLARAWDENFKQWFDRSGRTQPRVASGGVSGYSPGDARIGGNVRRDESVAFVAVTDRLGYWRGETLDLYTGTGWTVSGLALAGIREADGGEAPEPGTAVFEQEVHVRDPSLSRMLFSTGEIATVRELQSASGMAITPHAVLRDLRSGRYWLAGGHAVSYYRLVVVPMPSPSVQTMSAWEREAYLQLPDDLPERVRELAMRITADADTAEDKARTVEAYLRANYAYSLTGHAAAEDGDAVDHFLFESGQGYCDHFSTAMTVLMRASGVPARWVKGFAPGEAERYAGEGTGEDRWKVTVRNSDAHSWPEVYLEGRGWVAFEPTPGFGAGAVVSASAEPSSSPQGVEAEVAAAATGLSWDGFATMVRNVVAWLGDATGFGRFHWMVLAGIGGLVLMMVGGRLMWRWRAKRRMGLSVADAGGAEGREGERLIAACLRTLTKRHGTTIRQGQTLREYVASLPLADRPERKRELEKLVALLEEASYSRGGAGRSSERQVQMLLKSLC